MPEGIGGIVVATAAAIKHQRHQSASDQQRKESAEAERNPAVLAISMSLPMLHAEIEQAIVKSSNAMRASTSTAPPNPIWGVFRCRICSLHGGRTSSEDDGSKKMAPRGAMSGEGTQHGGL